MPNVIDPEIASYVQKHLQKHGIRVLTGVAAQEVDVYKRQCFSWRIHGYDCCWYR